MATAADLLKESYRVMITGIPIGTSHQEVHNTLLVHPLLSNSSTSNNSVAGAARANLLNTLIVPNVAQRCLVCFADYRTKEACTQCARFPLQVRGSACFVIYLGPVGVRSQESTSATTTAAATATAKRARSSAGEPSAVKVAGSATRKEATPPPPPPPPRVVRLVCPEVRMAELGVEKLKNTIESACSVSVFVEIVGDHVAHLTIPVANLRRLRKQHGGVLQVDGYAVQVKETYHAPLALQQFRPALFGDVLKSIAQLGAETKGQTGCYVDEYGNMFFQPTD